MKRWLNTIESVIADLRRGKMAIVVDDEDRENEGDLILAGEWATPAAVNFMAKYGRGLICVPTTSERLKQLGIEQMVTKNRESFKTDFQVSVDAAAGVTTGISAADRARTIQIMADPTAVPNDLVQPGHVFPLRAKPGGVLQRSGHTEAVVDLVRLAECRPIGVLCEIMNDDGTMARLPDLVAYAQRHNLKLGTIADLIAYRRTTERLVKPVEQGLVRAPNGYNWRMIAYQSQVDQVEHLAMVKGDVSTGEPVLVRMHAVDTVTDVVGGEHLASLHGAMTQIDEAGRGVVVLIRESRNTVVSERIRDLVAGRTAAPTLRDYGIGAQILTDLGVKDMILLSNHKRTIVGLEGYGLNVVEQRAIEGTGEK